MFPAALVRELNVVRDPSERAARRAFAAATLAAGALPASAMTIGDPADRMFGYGVRHPDTPAWDERSSRTGTITYIDDELVEQYVGQQRWIAYQRAQFADFRADVGDPVRIARRGDAVVAEPLGPNRLQADRAGAGHEVTSGMLVLAVRDFGADQLDGFARAIAERYSAALTQYDDAFELSFRGAAALVLARVDAAAGAVCAATNLLVEPVVAALRLTVVVHSQKLDAALEAERALVLLAAMLSGEGESIVVDDSGAIFSADGLYALATRNEMRGDAFAFAAAVVQRCSPPAPTWFSEREGICDEITLFSAQPWRADFASRFVERELIAFSEAARYTADPVIPTAGRVLACAASAAGAAGAGRTLLASLGYGSVEIDIVFIDLPAAGAELGALIDSRADIRVLLGAAPVHALVIAFGMPDPLEQTDATALELRRAETLATAFAAAFSGCGTYLATDVAGTLYSASELTELARRRCGKSTSWNARVAASSGSNA